MINPMFNTFSEFKQIFLDFDKNARQKISPLKVVLEKLKNKKYGLCLEFGVWKGGSISMIHEHLPEWDIYGFDSFEGLPEKWRDGFDANSFTLDGNIPTLHKDIKLIKGWFNETLPIWLQEQNSNKPIGLLHIDCDLYSSTKTIFDTIGHLITHKTVIVFDEFLHYPDYEKHEMLAFYEFLQKYHYDFYLLACGGHNSEQLAVVCSSMDVLY